MAGRVLWKGAISFGLVHIPVALYAAVSAQDPDMNWLDRRTMDPVGYKRINKRTGKEIERGDIVKGIEYEDGKYVVLTDEEIKAAYPKSTQSIDIENFVPAGDIPLVYLEKPYYCAPTGRGAKVYALLRETLRTKNRVGIARVVMHQRQHLAVLIPSGSALVLNLLRWGDEIRSWEDLSLPPTGKAAGLTDKEMQLAGQLVDDMSDDWDADDFRDSFRDEIKRLVDMKASEGELKSVHRVDDDAEAGLPKSAEIIDLSELLKRSLSGDRDGGERPAARNADSTAKKAESPATKSTPAKSTPAKSAATKSAATKSAETKSAETKAPSKAAPAKSASKAGSGSTAAASKSTRARKPAARKAGTSSASRTRRKAA